MSSRLCRALLPSLLLSVAVIGATVPVQAAAAKAAPAKKATAQAAVTKSDKAKSDDPVVARVGADVIRRSEVVRLFSQMPSQMQQLPPETVFPVLVERLVEQKLLAAAGYKEKLQKDETVREDVKRAEETAVARAYIKKALEARITPAAIEAAYQKQVAEFKPETEVKAAHILVDDENVAKDIIKQLAKGADFATLAKDKSKDRGSAAQGGDLGYFTAEMMVEPFAKAAFAMKKGDVSTSPVKSEYGWHIIKLEDIRQTQKPTLEESKAHIEESLRDEAAESVLKDLRAEAKVEMFAPDGSKLPPANATSDAAPQKAGDAAEKPASEKK